MRKLFKAFFILMFVVFSLYGIIGYLTFYTSDDVEEQTYLSLFKNNSSLIMLAQVAMLITSMIAYVFLFKPTRDLIETFVLKKLLSDKINDELGLQNILVTAMIKMIIIFFIYVLIKFEISFITLVDNLSELIIPWIFVILPIFTYMRVSGNRSYVPLLLISLVFFSITLKEKIEIFL